MSHGHRLFTPYEALALGVMLASSGCTGGRASSSGETETSATTSSGTAATGPASSSVGTTTAAATTAASTGTTTTGTDTSASSTGAASTGGTTGDLKAEILRLRDDPTTRGCQLPLDQLKRVGVDPLPAGYTLQGNVVRVLPGVTADDLEGWLFDEYRLDIDGTVNLISNCVFKHRAGPAISGWILARPGSNVGTIRWTTFDGDGPGENINGAVQGRFRHLHNCLFKDLSSDAIKMAGAPDPNDVCLIEGNYFTTPLLSPNDLAMWSPTTTYAAGEMAIINDPMVGNTPTVSLADGNTGNQPPNFGQGPTAWWKTINPHADIMQSDGDIVSPIKVRWNYFEFQATRRNHGLTSVLWFRPFGSKKLDFACDGYENIFDLRDGGGGSGTITGYPRGVAAPSPDIAVTVKPRIYNNWFYDPPHKWYAYLNGLPGSVLWGGNMRFDDTPLPLPADENDPDWWNFAAPDNGVPYPDPPALGVEFPGDITALGGGP